MRAAAGSSSSRSPPAGQPHSLRDASRSLERSSRLSGKNRNTLRGPSSSYSVFLFSFSIRSSNVSHCPLCPPLPWKDPPQGHEWCLPSHCLLFSPYLSFLVRATSPNSPLLGRKYCVSLSFLRSWCLILLPAQVLPVQAAFSSLGHPRVPSPALCLPAPMLPGGLTC